MQKWEYLEVGMQAVEGGRGEENAYYWFVDGKIHEPRTKDFARVANDLGEQGWELVTKGSGGCFFKRAKF
jgi:hypothetical protein